MTTATEPQTWTADDFKRTLHETHDATEPLARSGRIARSDVETINTLFARALDLRDAGRYDRGIEYLDRARRLATDLTTSRCAACGEAGPTNPCEGLGALCERCAMECPCGSCAA